MSRSRRRTDRPSHACAIVILLLLVTGGWLAARAAGDTGQVTFNGRPVPGATVTATQDERVFVATTDEHGTYVLPDVVDGTWTIRIDMSGFAPVAQKRVVGASTAAAAWSLEMLPIDALEALATPQAVPVQVPTPAAETAAADPGSADGLLINGSVNNGLASPFAQKPTFGNGRRGAESQYNGGLSLTLGSSRFDAAPFSFTADHPPAPGYGDVHAGGTFGGPLTLPGVKNRPVVFIAYQHSDDSQASTLSARVPTAAERAGQLDQPIVDPETGQPFPGNRIPAARISAQATALLALYPLPNVANPGQANFQRTSLTATGQDSVQSRWSQAIGARHSLVATFNTSRTGTTTSDLFGFIDTSTISATDVTANWSYRPSPMFSMVTTYHMGDQSTGMVPAFAHRTDIEGDAGILGASTDSANWGPPTLRFAGGLAGLRDAQASHTPDRSQFWTSEWTWRTHHGHSVTFGGGAGTRHLLVYGEQDPRGTFGFDGRATGSDVADFLLGRASSVSLAMGNGSTDFQGRTLNAYISDDWRVRSSLTVNVGLRWEYESPLDERDGRVVNLAVADDFSTATPLVGARLAPDWRGFQPRLSASWRPIAGSSVVVRAGYGVYRNTNVYQGIALLLAQQPPLSRAFSAQDITANPLTLADGLLQTSSTSGTFAVDPRFRVSDAQNWQVSMQRDLPFSLTGTATYLGTQGSHLMREFLPNTAPPGATSPCPACPAGYVYLTSDGSSRSNALQLQVRRRLRNGLSGLVQYTVAKATDDAAAFTRASLDGVSIAQDWTNLGAEFGRSSFDQRHLVTAQADYVGHGWFHDWALTMRLSRGSGFPVTPVVLVPVTGSGILGTVRPDLTAAGFVAPAPGAWGTAPRNSLAGPPTFAFDAGAGRLFPLKGRTTLEWRVDTTNALNRVTYASYDTTVGSPQFGLPNRANPMRKVQTTLRMRF